MHGNIQRRGDVARETIRQACRDTDTSVGDVLSDIAKIVLWPQNTAAHLAAASKCSVRQAERFLGGQCEWSGNAIAATVAEILSRHHMRNVKIVPKR